MARLSLEQIMENPPDIRKLNEAGLVSWVEGLIEKRRVEGVQAKGDRFVYDRLFHARELRLDFDVTILPPKKYFQPPRERLIDFTEEGGYESVIVSEPFVLFGVHPYDMIAIRQMDKVFSRDHGDIHYRARRESATIVVSDVARPSPNIFAGSMGTATVKTGFDVLVSAIGNSYLVDARTGRGRALLAGIQDADRAESSDLDQREDLWRRNEKSLRRHELKMDPRELPALLEKSFDHPIWEEKAQLCYSCGSCVLTCPTCYCFDVQDDVDWTLKRGSRSRSWDGCMLADFARVAGGHNFRRSKTERYRHRYYRKGKYLWDLIGEIACVGCGRCITACTSFISHPPEIFNRLWDDLNES